MTVIPPGLVFENTTHLKMKLIAFFIISVVLECRSSRSKQSKEKEVEFLDWFENNGGEINSVGLGHFQDQGRGIIALTDVKAGQTVLSIPMKVMFSADRLKASRDAVDKEILKLFTDDDDIVLASLLYESFRGPESFFAPYLQLLPAYVPSLLYFSAEALVELQDPDFEKEGKDMQASARTSYFKFMTQVTTKWPKEAVDGLTFEQYLWGLSIVNSRGLRFKGKVHLVPFSDMFNYAPHSEPRRATNGEFFLLHHKLDSNSKELIISSDRDQVAGGQLHEDYGDNTDKIYLQYHGFVAEHNPFRCVMLAAPKQVRRNQRTSSSTTATVAAADGNAGGDDPLLKALFDELQLSIHHNQPRTLSTCMDRSGDLGRTLGVYLTALSFDDEALQSCLDVFARENTRKNTATYWPTVMEDCGFNRVTKAINAAVETSSFTTLLTAPTAAAAAAATGKGSETNMIHRASSVIQQWVTDSVPDFPTTVEFDEQYLKSKSDPTNNDALHLQLSVKYRMHAKHLWKSICGLYGVDYSAALKEKRELAEGLPSLAVPEFVSLFDDNSTSLETKLSLFNDWFMHAPLQACKIKAVALPLVRIGTIATDDIKTDEKYLSVPQSIILDEYTALSDEHFRPLLRALRTAYKNQDDLHELMFFLLHERLVRHKNSKFWPYLRLLPTPRELDVPTTWSFQEIHSRLQPSFLALAVEIQKNVTANTFKGISTVKEVKNFFPPGFLTFENYEWASVIMDSRSIWWGGKRHLVPMLDFINCIEGPDPTKVHSTLLQESMLSGFSESYAVTKAGWAFKEGEQLFENYGQPNHIYFTYHGFSLKNGANSHDCVYLEFSMTSEEVQAIDWTLPIVRAIAQESRMRTQDKFSTCLDTKLERSIWLFLALKTNRIQAHSSSSKNEISKKDVDFFETPTASDKAYLLQFIETRIMGYEQHWAKQSEEVVHEASLAFLQTEYTVLTDIRQSLVSSTGTDKWADEL